MTLKEPKTEPGVSRRQLFRPFWGSSARRLRFAAYSFAVLCSLNVNLLLILGGRRSLIDSICCSFLHGFAPVFKFGFVHPIFSLWDINVTLGLLPSRGHVIWRGSVSVFNTPWATPGHLTFLKFTVQIFPHPSQNAVQMPHTRVHSGDQMPPPRGHFTGTKMTEGRRKRLQLSNKIFLNITKIEKHTVSVFTTNKSLVQSGGNHCYKITEMLSFSSLCNIQSVL